MVAEAASNAPRSSEDSSRAAASAASSDDDASEDSSAARRRSRVDVSASSDAASASLAVRSSASSDSIRAAASASTAGCDSSPGSDDDDGAAPPAEARDSTASSFSLSSDSLARSRFTAAAATWSFLWSSMIFSPSSSTSSRGASRVFAPDGGCDSSSVDAGAASAARIRSSRSPMRSRATSSAAWCRAATSLVASSRSTAICRDGGAGRWVSGGGRDDRFDGCALDSSLRGDGRVAHLRLGLESLVGHLKHVELGFLLREFTRHLILRDGRVGEVGISAKTREARIERRATSSSRSVGEFLRRGRTFAGVGVLENMADATVTCHVRWVHSPRASGVVCGAVAPGSVRGGARVKTRADARGGAARCALKCSTSSSRDE